MITDDVMMYPMMNVPVCRNLLGLHLRGLGGTIHRQGEESKQEQTQDLHGWDNLVMMEAGITHLFIQSLRDTVAFIVCMTRHIVMHCQQCLDKHHLQNSLSIIFSNLKVYFSQKGL